MNDKIRLHYDTIAQLYTDKYDWNYVDKGLLELFISYLNDANTKNVVDLACGNGKVSKFVGQAGFEVTGIDFSKQMLSIAQSKNSHKNVKYVNEDFRNHIFSENSAYILLFSLIHWSHKDQKKYLINFAAKLKSSLVLIAVQTAIIKRINLTGVEGIPVYCWSEKKFVEFLQSIGFSLKFVMKRTPWNSELPCEKLFLILQVSKNESSVN